MTCVFKYWIDLKEVSNHEKAVAQLNVKRHFTNQTLIVQVEFSCHYINPSTSIKVLNEENTININSTKFSHKCFLLHFISYLQVNLFFLFEKKQWKNNKIENIYPLKIFFGLVKSSISFLVFFLLSFFFHFFLGTDASKDFSSLLLSIFFSPAPAESPLLRHWARNCGYTLCCVLALSFWRYM